MVPVCSLCFQNHVGKHFAASSSRPFPPVQGAQNAGLSGSGSSVYFCGSHHHGISDPEARAKNRTRGRGGAPFPTPSLGVLLLREQSSNRKVTPSFRGVGRPCPAFRPRAQGRLCACPGLQEGALVWAAAVSTLLRAGRLGVPFIHVHGGRPGGQMLGWGRGSGTQ